MDSESDKEESFVIVTTPNVDETSFIEQPSQSTISTSSHVSPHPSPGPHPSYGGHAGINVSLPREMGASVHDAITSQLGDQTPESFGQGELSPSHLDEQTPESFHQGTFTPSHSLGQDSFCVISSPTMKYDAGLRSHVGTGQSQLGSQPSGEQAGVEMASSQAGQPRSQSAIMSSQGESPFLQSTRRNDIPQHSPQGAQPTEIYHGTSEGVTPPDLADPNQLSTMGSGFPMTSSLPAGQAYDQTITSQSMSHSQYTQATGQHPPASGNFGSQYSSSPGQKVDTPSPRNDGRSAINAEEVAQNTEDLEVASMASSFSGVSLTEALDLEDNTGTGQNIPTGGGQPFQPPGPVDATGFQGHYPQPTQQFQYHATSQSYKHQEQQSDSYQQRPVYQQQYGPQYHQLPRQPFNQQPPRQWSQQQQRQRFPGMEQSQSVRPGWRHQAHRNIPPWQPPGYQRSPWQPPGYQGSPWQQPGYQGSPWQPPGYQGHFWQQGQQPQGHYQRGPHHPQQQHGDDRFDPKTSTGPPQSFPFTPGGPEFCTSRVSSPHGQRWGNPNMSQSRGTAYFPGSQGHASMDPASTIPQQTPGGLGYHQRGSPASMSYDMSRSTSRASTIRSSGRSKAPVHSSVASSAYGTKPQTSTASPKAAHIPAASSTPAAASPAAKPKSQASACLFKTSQGASKTDVSKKAPETPHLTKPQSSTGLPEAAKTPASSSTAAAASHKSHASTGLDQTSHGTSKSDSSEEASQTPQRTVKVSGVTAGMTEERLQDYFEGRRSGGGLVEAVSMVDAGGGVAYVTFEKSEDAERVAHLGKHTLDKQQLEVTLHKPPKVMQNCVKVTGIPDFEGQDEFSLFVEKCTHEDVEKILYGGVKEEAAVVFFESEVDVQQVRTTLANKPFKGHNLEVSDVTESGVLLVRDLPPGVKPDMLRDYFESPRRGKAGEVTDVQLENEDDPGYALVTLKDAEAASKVVCKEHKINNIIISVSQFIECLGPSGGSEDRVLKIPQPSKLSPSQVQKISAVERVPALKEVLQSVLTRSHASLDVRSSGGDGHLLCTITKDAPNARRLLTSWEKNVRDALDGYLEEIGVYEEAMSTTEFAEAETKLKQISEKADGKVGAFFNNQNGKLCVVYHVQDEAKAADSMQDVITTTKRRLERAKQVKTETITVSPAEVEVLQKYGVEKNLLQKFPDMSVEYGATGGIITMTGLPSELEESHQQFTEKLREITSQALPFDQQSAAMTDLLKSESARKIIQDACLQADPLGAVRFETSSFTVYSLDNCKAQEMMEFGLKAIQKKEISLGEELTEAVNLPAFQNLLTSLETRNRDLLVTESRSPSLLVLLCVGPTFHDDVRTVETFLDENRLQKQSFPMKAQQQELFKLHLQNGKFTTISRSDDIVFDADNEKITATNTRTGLQETSRGIDAFLAKIVTEQREFTEPSFKEFIDSNEGRMSMEEAKNERRCAIRVDNGDADGAQGGHSLSFGLGNVTTLTSQLPTRREFAKPQVTATATQGASQPSTSADKLKNLSAKPKIFVRAMSDITKEEHDVLVNSSNCKLDLTKGQVSNALLGIGGPKLQQECKKKYPRGIDYGEIAVTGPGRTKEDSKKDKKWRLMCERIHHCCLPETTDHQVMEKVVKDAVTKILTLADRDKMTSVGFPALGTGTLKYPATLVAPIMFESVMEYGCTHPNTCISDVVVILHKKDTALTQVFSQELEKVKALLREAQRAGETFYMLPQMKGEEGQKRWPFFEATRGRVVMEFTALQKDDIDNACQDLLRAYNDTVRTVPRDIPKLAFWDEDFIQQVVMACKAVHVDVNFNFSMDRLELRGRLPEVGRVPLHHIIKDADNDVLERENAFLTAVQIQWNWVEVSTTESRLIPYDDLNNYKIEKAYKEGKDQAIVYDANKTPFLVDFTAMQERPEKIGTTDGQDDEGEDVVTVVRRDNIIEVAHDAPPPDNWRLKTGQSLDVVDLSPGDTEYKQVHSQFIKSLNQPGARVVKIKRIENLTLHKQYMSMRQQMKSHLPEHTVFEGEHEKRPLWHGTRDDIVDSIIENGFNRSYCERTGYGQGVYFAKTAEYSSEDKYAKRNGNGERHMFFCKVLVGKLTAGSEDMRYLPPNANDVNITYDSAVDDVNDPSIFVIFKDVQAYPEYLIVFKDN